MRRYLKALLIFLAMLASLPAANAQRAIPAQARLGVLQMAVFPAAAIDGENVRFGAGARIFNKDNQLVLPASLAGSAHRIAFTADFQGLVRTVWLVSEQEAQALLNAQQAGQR